MPIDTTTSGSPGWWMSRLSKKMEERNALRLNKLSDYFRGDPPLPTGAENAHDAYKAFQRKARSNFAELIVEAVRERMTPTGIRTGAGGDETGDKVAWVWWQANGMDVKVADVFESMLSLGDGYMIVGTDERNEPVITAEDPRQVITAHDPRDQRRAVAGLKIFHDPLAELDMAYLYQPGKVTVATHPRKRPQTVGPMRFSAAGWTLDEERSDDFPRELSDVMPVVRFRNRRGVGEFENHLDVLDRINHMLLQRMVIATMQAFKQRAIIGELPTVYPSQHPRAGEEIDYDKLFVADPGALWMIPGVAEMWESGQVDLTPILSSVKDDVMHLSAVTRTSLAMFSPESANQTAEGATAAREGQVFRTEDRIMRAKDGLIDVLHLAFRLTGDDDRAARDKIGIIWAPVERRSLAERADAASKAANDMDTETRLVELWQFEPEQAKRVSEKLVQEKATDPFLTAAAKLSEV